MKSRELLAGYVPKCRGSSGRFVGPERPAVSPGPIERPYVDNWKVGLDEEDREEERHLAALARRQRTERAASWAWGVLSIAALASIAWAAWASAGYLRDIAEVLALKLR